MDSEPQGISSGEEQQERISPTVTFENKGKTSTVAIEDVDSLFRGITSYSKQFSAGVSHAGMLKAYMSANRGDEGVASTPQGMTKQIDEESQRMMASGLNVIHGPTLENVGLSLEPVSGKSTTIFTSEGSIGTGEMRVNIKDRGQFVAFLKALTPDQVGQTPLGGHLGELTDLLNKQILDNYDLHDPQDETFAFLGSLSSIVDQYKRLGLGDAASKMEEYLVHSRQGDLREFVLVKTSGLMQEPGVGFGPAEWQKDAGPEFMQNKWGQALNTLRLLRNNPNANGLYTDMLKHLKNCLEISQNDLATLEYMTDENKREIHQVLNAVREGLNSFEE